MRENKIMRKNERENLMGENIMGDRGERRELPACSWFCVFVACVS